MNAKITGVYKNIDKIHNDFKYFLLIKKKQLTK